MKKQSLLVAGMGDIGRRLAAQHPQVRMLGMARSAESSMRIRETGAIPVMADLDQRKSLARLAGLSPWVLHLAPPPGDSEGDPRTRKLLAALARRGSLPRRLVYISTSGV